MNSKKFVRTASLAGLFAIGCLSPAFAAEGWVVGGSQWWDQSALDAKFQEFREVPRGAFLESFGLRDTVGRNDFTLWGANAIRRDQSSRLRWANGARWRADLSYMQIPHLFSELARWGWLQSTPGTFTLPDSLQIRNETNAGGFAPRMSDFLKNSPHVDLDVRTNITKARLRARPAQGWTFESQSRITKRSGLKPYAMSFGFNTAVENPEPIDQRIVESDLIAGYVRNRVTARLTGGVSVFDNNTGELRVDNPRRLTDAPAGDGGGVGQMDLYPDNRVVRGTAEMGYRFADYTSLSAMLGLADGKQDDPFLPFTINKTLPQNNPDSLPAQNLDAKTRELTSDVRLRSRLAQKLDGTLRFHYADFDNQTDVLKFIGQTPYESGWQRFIDLENKPLSSTRTVSGLDLDYPLTSRLRLGGIAEYRTRERTHREVEKDHENVFGGHARWNGLGSFGLAAHYTHGDRKQDAFKVDDYIGYVQGRTAGLFDSLAMLDQPGLRRYDVANRKQDHAGGDVSYSLGERVDLSASYDYLRNDFKSDTLLGLQEERIHSVASSGTIHVSDRLDLDGGYGLNLTKSNQRSRSSPAALAFTPDSNWTANLKEEEEFVFAGFDWQLRPRLSLNADYQFTRSITDFDLDNGLHNAADLPQVIFRRHEVLAEAHWQWLSRTAVIGRYGWEEYDTNDWATTNVPLIFPVTGATSAIFLGDSSVSYRAHRVALMVRHTF
jgi:MtrB/PioB family decaheme-associated outer membrane protein